MKIDKRLLLAGLAAMVAMAVLIPASSASAAVWKHGAVNLAKEITLTLSGGEVAELGSKGLSCEVVATLKTSGGSTGNITAFETKKCTGFGEMSKCTMTSSKAEGLPWKVTVNATTLSIANWRNKRTFSNCATAEIDKTVTTTTFTLLSSPAAISEVEFLGSIVGYKIFGSLTVGAPNAGTYGIG
jgi:hypothetical protein